MSDGRSPANSFAAVLVVVAMSTFLAMVAYTGPLGNAVTINTALEAEPAGATWVLASMSVGIAVTLLAAGLVADRVGRRRVFLLGLVIFTVANILGAAAPGTLTFVISRLLVGVGATGMIATGLGLVALTKPTVRQQATTATWWSVAMGGGIACGPLLSGVLDLVDAWRAFYALLAVVTGPLWVLARRWTPQDSGAPRDQRRPFDPIGFVLLVAFLTLLITAIVEVRNGHAGVTAGLFAASAVLFVLLLVSQRFGRRRLIDLSLLAHRPFLASTIAALGTGLSVISIIGFSSTYTVGAIGITTMQAGLLMALWSGCSVASALVLARFTARLSGATQLVIGLLGGGLGLMLATGVQETADFPRLIVGLVVSGAGTGVLNAGLARQSVATVPPGDVATGTAANNTARYLGAAIGMSAASMLAADSLTLGWDRVVLGGSLSAVVAAVLVMMLTATHARSVK